MNITKNATLEGPGDRGGEFLGFGLVGSGLLGRNDKDKRRRKKKRARSSSSSSSTSSSSSAGYIVPTYHAETQLQNITWTFLISISWIFFTNRKL